MSKPESNVFRFPIQPQADVPAYYIDSLTMMMNPFSVLFSCARMVGADEKGQIQAKVECQLYMSPAHMKATAKLLAQHVEIYEKQHGEIVLPQEAPNQGGPR